MDLSPLLISCKIAFSATLITFVLGIFAAWGVGMSKGARPILDAVLSLPLVLPPTVVGFFLLMLFSRNAGFGKFLFSIGINPLFTWGGGVFAATVVSFPVMYRTTRGAFEQVDGSIIAAARTLGMSEFRIFTKIMIPVSLPGIAAAVILSFARALGEFGATIMVAGNLPGKTQTMAVAIYTAMQGGNKALALRWVLIIFALSAIILLLMNVITQRFSKRRTA
ncbi:molybdate ABC transporter permease subunit [Treponema sp. C6A8]|uniref:molybdate ABC transporter permease subunit n=1 Tax=Treponema sp. C6A8 TaxID=1410609 RepID=UPI000481DB1F|nr:molybdate ABC transporter permease subunit [Treponema sp. C6A8]